MSSDWKTVYDMKCDSCGFTQQVELNNKWAELKYGNYSFGGKENKFDLCPSCLDKTLRMLGINQNEECKDCKKKKGLFK
jgi:hypothetical protein